MVTEVRFKYCETVFSRVVSSMNPRMVDSKLTGITSGAQSMKTTGHGIRERMRGTDRINLVKFQLGLARVLTRGC